MIEISFDGEKFEMDITPEYEPIDFFGDYESNQKFFCFTIFTRMKFYLYTHNTRIIN